ncbi:MAG: KEOPS complex subunit Pcc1 [Thermoplasmatota archaeon]
MDPPPGRHRATLSFQLADEAAARAVAGALAVEAGDGPEGSTCVLSHDGATLGMELEAGTVADLRAALNSAIRLLDAAHRTATVR